MPAGTSAYAFICEWPEPGRWSVAYAGKHRGVKLALDENGVPRVSRGGRAVGMTEHRGLPLDQAMVWAEDLALDMGADSIQLANKRASWRYRPASASPKMVGLAQSLGLTVADDEKAGKLSDRITTVIGSQRIDPLVVGLTKNVVR